MTKSTLKWFKRLAGLLVVLTVVAIAVPFVVPAEKYKEEIISRVKAATGRNLTISGPMKLTILPYIGVHMEQVALSNPKGYSATAMLDVQAATVEVAVMPLLSGQVQISKLVLESPKINLEVNAQGVPNWRFTPQDEMPELPMRHSSLELVGDAQAAGNAPHVPLSSNNTLDMLQRIQIGEVDINGGTLNYINQPSRKSYLLEKIGLQMSMKNIGEPFIFGGDVWFNKQHVRLDGSLTTLQNLLMQNTNAALKLTLASEIVRVALNMQITPMTLVGESAFSVSSLSALSGWIGGGKVDEAAKPLGVDMKGRLSCNFTQCTMENATLRLNDLTLSGRMGLAWANVPRPYVTAFVHSDLLDITPYLAEPARAENKFFLVPDAQAAPAAGWSEAPINFSALQAVDADVQLIATRFVARAFQASDLHTNTILKDGMLTTNVSSMELYEGKAKGEVKVDGKALVASINSHIEMQGVRLEKLLHDISQFDQMSGKAKLQMNLTSHGASQKAIISNLNGDGTLSVADGVLKGVNLASMQQSVGNLLSGGLLGVGPKEQTAFSELGGTFTITQGVVHNNDLSMVADSFRMKGAGKVDLPVRFVSYRIEPVLTGMSGKGGKQATLTVPPVIVEGPFEQLAFRPDLQSSVKSALNNPESAKETVNTVKEQIKTNAKGVKDLLKSFRH